MGSMLPTGIKSVVEVKPLTGMKHAISHFPITNLYILLSLGTCSIAVWRQPAQHVDRIVMAFRRGLCVIFLVLYAVSGATAGEIDCYGATVRQSSICICFLLGGFTEHITDSFTTQVEVLLVSSPEGLHTPPTAAIYGYPAAWGTHINETASDPYEIYVLPAPHADACDTTKLDQARQRHHPLAAVVRRGNCSFVQKARNLQAVGYKGMILFDDQRIDDCVEMGTASNDSALEVTLIGISVTASGAEALKELEYTHGKVTIRQPNVSHFDPAEGVLLLLALGTIFIGSVWMGHPERPPRDIRDAEGNLAESHDELDAVISQRAAAAFALVASAALLFLYFTLSIWLLAILTGLFALIAWQATTYVLGSGFQAVGFHFRRTSSPSQTRFTAHSVAAIFSAVMVATWLCFHGTHWSWVLQDSLSVSLLIVMIHSIVLPNLKVGTILLCGALVYDVWWVFLQPAVLGGRSIMVEVATGGDDLGFHMPMVLTVPQFWGLGTNPAMAVLGLGDVVLPGLLVAMGRRWDLHKAKLGTGLATALSLQYFLALLIAYGGGLAVTFVALARGWGGNEGQPALLYLCPATLGMAGALAWANGDLRALWEWNGNPHAGHASVGEHDVEGSPVEDAPLLNSSARSQNELIP